MKLPEKLTQKARSIIEYRPTRHDILATLGVLAAAATCMFIEDQIRGDDHPDEQVPAVVVPTPSRTTTTITTEL